MSSKNIAVINLGTSNLRSIFSACKYLDFEPILVEGGKNLSSFSCAILPGVGAFNHAAERIKKLDLEYSIKNFIKSGKPFLGICLGMQLLLSKSEEFGETEGLNIIKGNVKKFHSKKIHIGWSQVKVLRKQKLLKDEDFMYFVHSYYVDLVDKKNALTNTNFDNNEFCSSFIYENILACQFHPEKSGPSGLNLLKKFISQEYNYYD